MDRQWYHILPIRIALFRSTDFQHDGISFTNLTSCYVHIQNSEMQYVKTVATVRKSGQIRIMPALPISFVMPAKKIATQAADSHCRVPVRRGKNRESEYGIKEVDAVFRKRSRKNVSAGMPQRIIQLFGRGKQRRHTIWVVIISRLALTNLIVYKHRMARPHFRNNHSMSHRGTVPNIQRVVTQALDPRTQALLNSSKQKRPPNNAACVIIRPCRIGDDFRFQQMGKLTIGIPSQRIRGVPCPSGRKVVQCRRDKPYRV